MAWDDRLREAAYTSPGGTRLTFTYEQVSEAFEAKTTAFDFADADGTYVQDLGRTGRRYPLRIIVWGADYDLEAEAWMAALREAGQGILEHPAYGRVDVVPVGKVTRRDDLVRSANQAVIEVEFFETTGLVYPAATESARGELDAVIAEADQAQADQLAGADVLNSATERADFQSRYLAALDQVETQLRPLTENVESAQRQFDGVQQSINRGIDVLIAQPLALANQTQQLIKTPARIAQQVGARLDAYHNLFNQITGNTPERATALYNSDLYASAVVIGTVEATSNTQYTRRPDAIKAAELLLQQAEELADWRDTNFAALNEVDQGGSWQATQEAVAQAAGSLVALSFGLATERRVVLTSDRSLIDLEFELYGTVDENTDALINDNNLSGDEIIELPRGREVIYYVA